MIKLVVCIVLLCACIYSQPVTVAYWIPGDTILPGAETSSDSVFAYAKSLSSIIDYDDCNICKSRAHILARAIEKRFPQAIVAKLWIVAECKTSSNREKYRTLEHKLLRYNDNCGSWVYHVAPVVITANDTIVIDPATQKSPVKVNKWVHSLIRAEATAVVVLKDKEYFIYPDDAYNLFEDKKTNWDDSDEPVKDKDYSRAIDEVTRAKLGLLEPWKMNEHIKKLKELIK
jgi:hypothetical protein